MVPRMMSVESMATKTVPKISIAAKWWVSSIAAQASSTIVTLRFEIYELLPGGLKGTSIGHDANDDNRFNPENSQQSIEFP